MSMRVLVCLRLMATASAFAEARDEVALADARVTLADARAAYNIARGVPIEYLDPATGQDFSPRAYRAARRHWPRHLASGGDRAVVEHGLDRWLERRPDVVAAVEEVDAL